MREIRTSGLMSGEGKRGVAAWPKLPRPSSTLPIAKRPAGMHFRTAVCASIHRHFPGPVFLPHPHFGRTIRNFMNENNAATNHSGHGGWLNAPGRPRPCPCGQTGRASRLSTFSVILPHRAPSNGKASHMTEPTCSSSAGACGRGAAGSLRFRGAARTGPRFPPCSSPR
jgi:hypothetical protein